MMTLMLLLSLLAVPVFAFFYVVMTHFRVSEIDRLARLGERGDR